MGALTVAKTKIPGGAGSWGVVTGTIAFSNSYANPAGDTGLTLAALGVRSILSGSMEIGAKEGYQFQWVPSNGNVRAFRSAGFTPAGTNSAPTITTATNASPLAIGTAAGALAQTTGAAGITGVQAPTFTGTVISAAPLTEVGNGVDLSGVTGVPFSAFYR